MGVYESFNVDCIGYSHVQNGLPKQDSSYSFSGQTENGIPYSIAIIADGHGSSQYFRSDIGSRLAVEVCKALIVDLIKSERDARKNEDKLKKLLKTEWDNSVKNHFKKNPLTCEELQRLKSEINKCDTNAKKEKLIGYCNKFQNGESINKAYGSTLIAVAAWKDIVIGIHIGDGTCVAFYEDGSFDQPIPTDKNNVANITGSLCNDDPCCRIYFFEKRPVALFVASDGLDDSYGQGEALYNYYKKVCINLVKKGEKCISKDDLSKISEKGSKDDMSIACLYDKDYLSKYHEYIKVLAEIGDAKIRISNIQENNDGISDYALNAKKNKKEKLEQDLNNLTNEYGTILESIKVLESKKNQYESDKKDYENKYSNAKNKWSLKKDNYEDMVREIDYYLSEYNSKITSFKKKIEELNSKRNTIKQEHEKYETAIKELPGIRFKIQDEIERRENLKKLKDTKNKEFYESQLDYNDAFKKRENLESEKKQLQNIVNELKKEAKIIFGKICSSENFVPCEYKSNTQEFATNGYNVCQTDAKSDAYSEEEIHQTDSLNQNSYNDQSVNSQTTCSHDVKKDIDGASTKSGTCPEEAVHQIDAHNQNVDNIQSVNSQAMHSYDTQKDVTSECSSNDETNAQLGTGSEEKTHQTDALNQNSYNDQSINFQTTCNQKDITSEYSGNDEINVQLDKHSEEEARRKFENHPEILWYLFESGEVKKEDIERYIKHIIERLDKNSEEFKKIQEKCKSKYDVRKNWDVPLEERQVRNPSPEERSQDVQAIGLL